jgi:hypothetical protein
MDVPFVVVVSVSFCFVLIVCISFFFCVCSLHYSFFFLSLFLISLFSIVGGPIDTRMGSIPEVNGPVPIKKHTPARVWITKGYRRGLPCKMIAGPLRLSTGHRDEKVNPYAGSSSLVLFNDSVGASGHPMGRELGMLADIQSGPFVASQVWYDYDRLDNAIAWILPRTLSLRLTARQQSVGSVSSLAESESYALHTLHIGRKIFAVPRLLVDAGARAKRMDAHMPLSVRSNVRWSLSEFTSGSLVDGNSRVRVGDLVLCTGGSTGQEGVWVAETYLTERRIRGADIDELVYVEEEDMLYKWNGARYVYYNPTDMSVETPGVPSVGLSDVTLAETQKDAASVLAGMMPANPLTIQAYRRPDHTLVLRSESVTDALRLYELSSPIADYGTRSGVKKLAGVSAIYLLHDETQPTPPPYASALMTCTPKTAILPLATVQVTEVVVAVPRSTSDSMCAYGDNSTELGMDLEGAQANPALRNLIVTGAVCNLMLATIVPVFSLSADAVAPSIAMVHSMTRAAAVATSMPVDWASVAEYVMWRVVLYGPPDTHLGVGNRFNRDQYNACAIQIYPAIHFDTPLSALTLHLNRGCKRQYVQTQYTMTSLVLPRMASYRSILGRQTSRPWSPMEATHVELSVGDTRISDNEEVTCRSQPYRSFETRSSLVPRSAPARCAEIPPLLVHTLDLFIRCGLTQPLSVLPKEVGGLMVEVRDDSGYVLDITPAGALERAPVCSPRRALSHMRIEGNTTRSPSC